MIRSQAIDLGGDRSRRPLLGPGGFAPPAAGRGRSAPLLVRVPTNRVEDILARRTSMGREGSQANQPRRNESPRAPRTTLLERDPPLDQRPLASGGWWVTGAPSPLGGGPPTFIMPTNQFAGIVARLHRSSRRRTNEATQSDR